MWPPSATFIVEHSLIKRGEYTVYFTVNAFVIGVLRTAIARSVGISNEESSDYSRPYERRIITNL